MLTVKVMLMVKIVEKAGRVGWPGLGSFGGLEDGEKGVRKDFWDRADWM